MRINLDFTLKSDTLLQMDTVLLFGKVKHLFTQNGTHCTMKCIRILHTADLHLDASFAPLGVNADIGAQLRAAQQRVFSEIMQRASDWPADLVLIAGDLFDSAQVRAETLAFVMETLEYLAPIPVYIAPGNRDPYNEHSPYATELWPENVVIFKPQGWQQQVHPVQQICVHGIGCDGKDDSGDWFQALHIEKDDRLHVAVAHGTEKNHQPEHGKTFAPFDAASIAQDRLAYMALGHFHDATEINGTSPTPIQYPGVPQGRNFNEQGKRYFLEVNVENNKGKTTVRTTPVACNDVSFHTCSCSVGAHGNPEADVESVIKGDPSRQVMRFELTGKVPAPTFAYLDRLQQYARNRFLHAVFTGHVECEQTLAVLTGSQVCLSRFNTTMMARMTDAADDDTAIFQAYARDLALAACRDQALPQHHGEEAQS